MSDGAPLAAVADRGKTPAPPRRDRPAKSAFIDRPKEHLKPRRVCDRELMIGVRSMVKVSIVVLLASFGLAGAAEAGCLSGAAAGAVVGHVAGHHGVAGAAVGCAIGHHRSAKEKQAKQDNQAIQNQRNQSPSN